MENTLERLLRIQGQPEQISMEEAPAPPDQTGGQGDAAAAREAAPPARIQAQQPKTAPEVLEAWRGAFRLFTKYAQPIRAAAHKDDENAEAAAIFTAAAEEARAIYSAGGDAEILSIGVYGMLEEVFRREQKQRTPF